MKNLLNPDNKLPFAILLSFLSYTCFAFMDLINKFLFSYINIPFFSYMFWLDLAILICLIPLGIFTSNFSLAFLKTTNAIPVFIRSIFSLLNTICSLIAISHLPFHIFYSLAFIQPIITTFLSIIFFMEKPNITKIILIVLGFLGVLISIEIWSFSSNPLPLIGLLAGLGISITNALSGLVVKKYMPAEKTITIAIYNVLLSFFVASLYFIFTQKTLFITTNPQIIILVFFGGLTAALGMIFFMLSYQKGYIQSIVSMQYTQIIWGIIFGIILFNTLPSFYSTIGITIIIITNLINIAKK